MLLFLSWSWNDQLHKLYIGTPTNIHYRAYLIIQPLSGQWLLRPCWLNLPETRLALRVHEPFLHLVHCKRNRFYPLLHSYVPTGFAVPYCLILRKRSVKLPLIAQQSFFLHLEFLFSITYLGIMRNFNFNAYSGRFSAFPFSINWILRLISSVVFYINT